MTPILLPFPEDSDGLLTFKKIIVLLPRFLKPDALEEVKFWWVYRSQTGEDSATGKLYVMKKGSVPTTSDPSQRQIMYEALGVNTQTRVTRNPRWSSQAS